MPEERSLVIQMIEQNREKAEEHDVHRRKEHESLERRVTATELQQVNIAAHLDRLDDEVKRPVEVSALRLTPQMVAAIVIVCVTIVGGQKWSSDGIREEQAGIRSDVRDLGTRLDTAQQATAQHVRDIASQLEAAKLAEAANARLQDEHTKALRDAIDLIVRQQKLTDLAVQHLNEAIISVRRQEPEEEQ